MNLIVPVLTILALVVVAAYLVGVYNGLVLLKNNIVKAWANIDVLLKQRHDEIPKLIAVCEGYMSHERNAIDRVARAREVLMSVSQRPEAMGAAEGELRQSLRQLFALAENYPDLKAQSGFQQLQNRISGLESEIADRREFYNESVNNFNIRIASLPDVFIARLMGLSERPMFQVSDADKQDVTISFKS
jgi:LemA protein